MILPGRIIYENVTSFLPNKDSSFVVYDKYADTYMSDDKKWSNGFDPDYCVFNHTPHKFTTDILVITELFNHLYKINKLDILTMFEYTPLLNDINFIDVLFDGKRDYTTIVKMVKESNV